MNSLLTTRFRETAEAGNFKKIMDWFYSLHDEEKELARKDIYYYDHLAVTCQYGDLQSIKFFVEDIGCNVDDIKRFSRLDNYPFNIACEFQNLECVKYLYSKGAFPAYHISEVKHTSLWHAARNSKDPEVLYYLIETLEVPINTDTYVWKENIFMEAIKYQELPVVEYLAAKGINTDGHDILHEAFAYARLDTICYLLSLGFDINKRNKLGKTPPDCVNSNKFIPENNRIDFMNNYSKLISLSIYKSTFMYKLKRCIQETLYYKRMLS